MDYNHHRWQLAWDMFFAGICAFMFHPGNRYANSAIKDHTDQELIEYSAHLTNMMMKERAHHTPISFGVKPGDD